MTPQELGSAAASETPTPLETLEGSYLDLAYLIVTHWGYLRTDARQGEGLSGMFFREADALLNPIFGTPEQAHRAVLNALVSSKSAAAVPSDELRGE